MKTHHLFIKLRLLLFAVSSMLVLFACQKRDSHDTTLSSNHAFTKLPMTADGRLAVFTDSLMMTEVARPWMDSVLEDIGAPGWQHAAFGIQNGAPSVMVPLLDHQAGQVTGLLVMVMGERFQYRIIDSRKPERYGYNNGKNIANARTIFIAADLFNQRAFPDKAPAAIGDDCMMTRTERLFFEQARKTGGTFKPVVKAAGYALSVTCYTTMVCTGDGKGNCVGTIVYHTDCLYNYIWVDGSGGGYSSTPGGSQAPGGGGAGGSTPGQDTPGNCVGAEDGPPQHSGPLAVLPPDKPITDIKQYITCFDRSDSAKITLYSDQPEAGSDEAFTVKGKVGHSYITIEQFSHGQVVRRTLGFHPLEAVSPFFATEGQSQLGDDSDAAYDVRLDINVTPDVLDKVLRLVENYNPRYHLEDYNCTNFVLDVADACGLKIPRTKAWWILGSGLNPGSFGQDLKKIPGATVGQGRSDANAGNCK